MRASAYAAFPPLHASSPQQLIASADTAMHAAKAANKNCIRFPLAFQRVKSAATKLTSLHDI